MGKETYRKRLKGNWTQGKSYKGDDTERMYAKQEIAQAVREMDEAYEASYRKSKRRRNEKARLQHSIDWYTQALVRNPGGESFAHYLRDGLRKAKARFKKLYPEEPNE